MDIRAEKLLKEINEKGNGLLQIAARFNRGLPQTNILYQLCDSDMKTLIRLELKMEDLHILWTPISKQEVISIFRMDRKKGHPAPAILPPKEEYNGVLA